LSPKISTVFETKVWSVLTPATTCAGLDLLRVDRDLDRRLEGRFGFGAGRRDRGGELRKPANRLLRVGDVERELALVIGGEDELLGVVSPDEDRR
jgi:hypothetical protein